MLNYIPFYTNIWSDKKFKKLSNNSRLLFIYLFANTSVNLTGIYELDIDTCKFRMNMNNIFEATFNDVIGSGLIKWDAETETIFVINRFKLIPNKSPKVIQGVINELNIIKHPFKAEFIKLYNDFIKPYMPNLKDYDDTTVNLLNEEQIRAWVKIGWQRERIKKFYTDRNYPEQRINEIINTILPNIR